MNITFRTARENDRRYHDWGHGYDDNMKPYKPLVVTYNGKVMLMIGRNNQVLYQFGVAVEQDYPEMEHEASAVVADLVRAWKRTVLILHEIEGLSAEEIAEIAGIPKNTVFTRLHHARKVEFRKARRLGKNDGLFVW